MGAANIVPLLAASLVQNREWATETPKTRVHRFQKICISQPKADLIASILAF